MLNAVGKTRGPSQALNSGFYTIAYADANVATPWIHGHMG